MHDLLFNLDLRDLFHLERVQQQGRQRRRQLRSRSPQTKHDYNEESILCIILARVRRLLPHHHLNLQLHHNHQHNLHQEPKVSYIVFRKRTVTLAIYEATPLPTHPPPRALAPTPSASARTIFASYGWISRRCRGSPPPPLPVPVPTPSRRPGKQGRTRLPSAGPTPATIVSCETWVHSSLIVGRSVC